MEEDVPVLIRRHARSRLYHPAAGRYVSVPELRAWARRGVAFAVVDAETGADVTAVLLA